MIGFPTPASVGSTDKSTLVFLCWPEAAAGATLVVKYCIIFGVWGIYILMSTRAELIDGQIYYMAPPTRRHQDIVGTLYRKIADYIDSKGDSCKTYVSLFAVFLNENDKNYVEPDISVICDQNKLNDKGCSGAPDWIIEIVSPGSRKMDYFTKLFKYRTAGVREYWIVDPVKNLILVYNFDTSDSEQYTFSDTVKAGIYDDLCIDFSKITL